MEDEKSAPIMDSGEKRLNELGYKQTLKRELSLFKMFALTMSTITFFTGVVPYFGISLLYGGTIALAWGWWITVFFVFFVALSLAEICSSFPTTGSLYFWAYSLAGPKYGPFACWITGWCEFVGIAIGSGGQAFAGTQLLQYIILLATGGANGGGYMLTKPQFLGIIYATLACGALMNSLPIKQVARIGIFSMFLQLVGGFTILVTLPILATKRQSVSFVYSYWEDNRESTGLPNAAYSWITACLISQYALSGFDIAAHMSEETKNADISGPISIMGSFFFTSIFAYVFAISLTFSMQSIERLFDPTTVTGGGYPVAQIIWDAFHDRFGNGSGAYFFLTIMYLSFFLGSFAVLLVSGRVAYAFARDNGIPLSFIWKRVDKNKVPVNAVWLCAFLGAVAVTPILKNDQAFFALSSMCLVSYLAAYMPSMFFRIYHPEENFHPGPFYLGRYLGKKYCKIVHIIALTWVLYTCCIFLLPYSYPITWEAFNYAPPSLAIVVTFYICWWFVSARKWFKGPVKDVVEEEPIYK